MKTIPIFIFCICNIQDIIEIANYSRTHSDASIVWNAIFECNLPQAIFSAYSFRFLFSYFSTSHTDWYFVLSFAMWAHAIPSESRMKMKWAPTKCIFENFRPRQMTNHLKIYLFALLTRRFRIFFQKSCFFRQSIVHRFLLVSFVDALLRCRLPSVIFSVCLFSVISSSVAKEWNKCYSVLNSLVI